VERVLIVSQHQRSGRPNTAVTISPAIAIGRLTGVDMGERRDLSPVFRMICDDDPPFWFPSI
jgi:hypothetical protein